MKLIKKCARLAAARSENAEVSPFVEDNTRGSVYQVMLSQFKRALGIMSVSTNAETKIERIWFTKDSVVEVDAVAQPNHPKYNYKRRHSWYENDRNEELYNEFLAYHSHKDDWYGF